METQNIQTPKSVYALISKVTKEIAKTGIAKSQKNQQQGYHFRGIDDVYNTLAKLISEVGLVILPRVTSREVVERMTAKGNAVFYVCVYCDFDFVSSLDGSTHTIKTYGEAMDSGDKATNKAMSAAYKYAVMQAFCIPTIGDNDADATSHEVDVDINNLYKEYIGIYKNVIAIDPTLTKFHPDNWGAEPTAALYLRAIPVLKAKLNELKK